MQAILFKLPPHMGVAEENRFDLPPREQDFEPARYRLQMYGLCAGCRAEGRTLEWKGLTCPIEL